MHRSLSLLLVVLVLGVAASDTLATPTPNSAVINTRIFNDFPTSTLGFSDLYPASITISDDNSNAPPPPGFANLHNWRFSENNFTPAVFNNGDAFSFGADLVINSTPGTVAEAGLQISPWWSQNVDGRLNVRVHDGEIAAFGGRLPFYSFTASHGINYVAGTPIRLDIIYDPNTLNAGDPATIQYLVNYGGNLYASGELAFDSGNLAEDPPHGRYGILNDARVGGHLQAFNGTGGSVSAAWSNITFAIPEPASLMILGLGGMAALRRRR